MHTTFSLSELEGTVWNLLPHFTHSSVIAFHGEMGAGKTTFISTLCKAMGVEGATSSPTFSIINQYVSDGGTTIYHMDWYRLRDEEEAIQAGVEDALYSGYLCLVEWPEKAPSLLPSDTLHVKLEAINSNTRRLTII
jgi:tRNA threonylcarbamoyladenosine biosynthesis protein TsaE